MGTNPYHKKKSGGTSLLRWILRFFLFLCTAALLISYISIFISPAKLWFPLYFGLFFIPICAINIVLLITLLFLKDKYWFVPLIALIPSLFFANMFVKIGDEQIAPQGETIRLLSYNIGAYDYGAKGNTREQTADQIVGFIREQDAEVVCLQEFSISDTLTLNETYPQYPYHHFQLFKEAPYLAGNLTLSKYPILSKGEVIFENTGNKCIYSDILANGHKFRVYNCHLESYRISFTSLVKLIGVGEKLKNATIKRSDQVDRIVENSKKSPYPSIICGDFNDTPLSYTYHQLTKGRKDSFIEGGSGFSSTYSILWPILRIDYILLPESFQGVDHTIKRVSYSDHYPIQATFYHTDQ